MNPLMCFKMMHSNSSLHYWISYLVFKTGAVAFFHRGNSLFSISVTPAVVRSEEEKQLTALQRLEPHFAWQHFFLVYLQSDSLYSHSS